MKKIKGINAILVAIIIVLTIIISGCGSSTSDDVYNSTDETATESNSNDEAEVVSEETTEETTDVSDEDTDSTSERSVTLLNNGMLLDANYNYETMDVLVSDGVIVLIAEEIDESLADVVVDLDGYTLMPGFIDAHVHVASSSESFSSESIEAWLANGVTAVGDLGMLSTLSAEDYIEWLNEQNDSMDSTFVVSAGKYIDVEGGYGAGPMPDAVMGNMIESADEASEAVQYAYDLGYTVVKIGLSENGNRMTSDMIIAIVEKCQELGITLTAHISTSEQVEELLNYGVTNFAHTPGDTMSDELITSLVEAGAVMHSTLDGSETMVENIVRFYEAGGTIISSTDLIHSSNWSEDAKIPYTEMAQLLANGVSLQDVIASATINAAEFLGIDDTDGTIEVGKKANFVAVQGELDDTLEALDDVNFIMYNGLVIEELN